MPKGEFYDLGQKDNDKRAMPMGMEEKVHYPTLNLDFGKMPAFSEMKLGDTGIAAIKFKINTKYGGIDILAIKHMETMGVEDENKKKKKKSEDMDEGGSMDSDSDMGMMGGDESGGY